MSILDFFVSSSNKKKNRRRTGREKKTEQAREKARRSGMRTARYSESWRKESENDAVSGTDNQRLRIDIQAPDDRVFQVAYDGPRIATIRELKDTVKKLTPDQLSAHIRHDGNDFAAWVRDVFGEQACAEMLARAGSGDEMIEILGRFCERHDKK